jgi:hypothetical protein
LISPDSVAGFDWPGIIDFSLLGTMFMLVAAPVMWAHDEHRAEQKEQFRRRRSRVGRCAESKLIKPKAATTLFDEL